MSGVAHDWGVFRLYDGDCLDAMRSMPDNSVDSVVTDPPYGLSFMGKKWDYDVPGTDVWAEALRVLKPGGYLLAFAGTRTQHRMCVRIEDAGFEIRDMLAWVYGSGFPKSLNVSKALDAAAGAAREWQGWGTALKPAFEPITMARKPFASTVAANILAHGTGALNIDASRVAGESTVRVQGTAEIGFHGGNYAPGLETGSSVGRWPANLIHDGSDDVLAVFPNAPGTQGPVRPNSGTGQKTNGILGNFAANNHSDPRGDAGSAARFFYCAKASRADREQGLEGMATQQSAVGDERPSGSSWERRDPERNPNHPRANVHPTVKPTDLMRYLCRLVTPPGGVVLDPFMGSGSTGKAAMLEGFKFIGCERDPAYMTIAQARIAYAKFGDLA